MFTSRWLVAVVVGLATLPAAAQTLHDGALVSALRHGGYVIVMRHAKSPETRPSRTEADAENTGLERQLDATGRASATAMGHALRELKIPIGRVVTSPTYRARETAKLAGWTSAESAPEIGDNGRGMQQVVPQAQASWLRQQAADAPRAGTNTILVTHQPNIARAFPNDAAGLGDGEALIFRPDGKGGTTLVARVKIDEWPAMAKSN